MVNTIKINLTKAQKAQIEELIKEDVDKNLYSEIVKICIYLNEKKFNKTEEFIKTKVNEICLLDSKSALINFKDEFELALKEDSKGNDETSEENIRKYIELEYKKLYLNFSKRAAAYKILNIMKVNVCPYCNRQYTFTVKSKIRPEFDHYFPKSKYPILTMSIYNLVPSCSLCNKGKSDKTPDDFLYPFEESFEDKGIHFEILNVIGNFLKQEKIAVKLESVEENQNIMKQYNDSFKIELLYNQHSDYILELLQKKYIFNDEAIESIYRSYKEFLKSPSELKQLIFGNCEPDNFNQRPLSKLTKDIIQQLAQK